MDYYCGIDLGTSSVKVLLMEEKGHVLDTKARGYGIKKGRPEEAEQDMEELWQKTGECIGTLMKKYPDVRRQIKGISYSGQMHGMVAVDREGRPVRNAVIWADQRSEDIIEHIWEKVPEETWKKITKNAPCTGFLAVSLLWMKENEPKNYERTAKVMLPKDYIRYKMCGEIGTDMTDGSSTGIFHVEKRQWAWELIDSLGLDRELFPVCRESYERAGRVTRQCAEETGLLEGTEIFFGGGDSMMQLTGNGIIRPGILSCNIGTASQIACAVWNPLYDREFRTNTFCHVKENLWNIQGSSLTGGVALKWLKEQILYTEDFWEMTKLAEQAEPGCEGLLFLPYLSGERCPYNNPRARGIYHGLSLYHNRAHLIRSTMEGLIFGLRQSLEIFLEQGITFEKLVASGGGARGRLFRQIQADVFKVPVYTQSESEQACVGAAITAAVGSGAFSSFEEACAEVVHLSDEVVYPAAREAEIYEECFARYRELYSCNQPLFS